MKKPIAVFLALLVFAFAASTVPVQATTYVVSVIIKFDEKIVWTHSFTVETTDPVVIEVPQALHNLIVSWFGTNTFVTPFTYSWAVYGHTFTLEVTSEPPDFTIVLKPIPKGDANRDRYINIKDLVSVAKAFGSTPKDALYNFFTDFNVDGIINIYDLILCARNYGNVY